MDSSRRRVLQILGLSSLALTTKPILNAFAEEEAPPAEDPADETQEETAPVQPVGDENNSNLEARLAAVEAQLNANTNQEKADLIASLVANERCPLEEEALKKLGVPELKALAGSYAPADYSGRGGFRTQQQAGDLVEAPMPEAE